MKNDSVIMGRRGNTNMNIFSFSIHDHANIILSAGKIYRHFDHRIYKDPSFFIPEIYK